MKNTMTIDGYAAVNAESGPIRVAAAAEDRSLDDWIAAAVRTALHAHDRCPCVLPYAGR